MSKNTEEPFNEKIFSLEDIDYSRFWGTNEKMLDFVRILFPKLKLVVRGEMLKVIGSNEDIEFFEGKFNAMLTYYEKFGRINENAIMQIMENGGSTPEAETNDEILVHGRDGILVKARTPNQKRLVDAIKKNDMVFAIGPAGTGKTYTAVALAVRALKNKEIRRIILTRPAVEAGENLGFLPGDLRDKLDPYLQPLYDALRDMIPQQKLLSYWEDNTIEIAPLAFMRGRTLDNAFVILDEAQNATSSQLKMFLTRMGRNAKFVITGDVTQIDLPRHQTSGLTTATQILKDIEGVELVQLDNSDVVRHRLVTRIIRAYDRHELEEEEAREARRREREAARMQEKENQSPTLQPIQQ
ncbi:MAG: PhoH family protein [Bacteroidales bacterium]|nr:PhoH family protein [Bacteroidales bacterium]